MGNHLILLFYLDIKYLNLLLRTRTLFISNLHNINKSRASLNQLYLTINIPFLLKDESLRYFTRTTGSTLAYDYALTGDDLSALTPYSKNIIEIYNDTENVEIIKLERNIPQKIRMFIWLEGQDIDCAASAKSATFAVNIELAGGNE